MSSEWKRTESEIEHINVCTAIYEPNCKIVAICMLLHLLPLKLLMLFLLLLLLLQRSVLWMENALSEDAAKGVSSVRWMQANCYLQNCNLPNYPNAEQTEHRGDKQRGRERKKEAREESVWHANKSTEQQQGETTNHGWLCSVDSNTGSKRVPVGQTDSRCSVCVCVSTVAYDRPVVTVSLYLLDSLWQEPFRLGGRAIIRCTLV